MPTLRVKRFAVRDATTLKRLSERSFLTEKLAQITADKFVKRGKAAVVVPVED